MVSAGSSLVKFFTPQATFSFYLSEEVFMETFELLFWILPFVYLLCLPFVFACPISCHLNKRD